MSKEDNIRVFKDTQKGYTTDTDLKRYINESISNQKVYKDSIEYTPEVYHEGTNIVVSKKRTFAAAEPYVKSYRKVCVLNFASATNPGGGVIDGSSAQEECLCRVSTLYPCLCAERKNFYNSHINALKSGEMTAVYNDDCIYTPNVCVFKTDTDMPVVLSKKERYFVDVVTCAAPNLREKPSNRYNFGGDKCVKLRDSELFQVHLDRAEKVLGLAAMNKCDVVILGAFGCGAFKNSPNIVAQAYRKVLGKYKGVFETIEFAVYCGKDTSNFDAFNRLLSKMWK